MIAYIDRHKDDFGVESICRTLGATDGGFLTTRGYRAAKARPRSARAVSDDLLTAEITRIHTKNYSVYGVRKIHAAMRRAGRNIGRDQVARLMKAAGVHGIQRGRRVFTTTPSPAASRPADLVDRAFWAQRPNQLWVVDMTYVRTWSGFAYTAFVTDVFSRRIVGWNVKATMKTETLPLEAFDQAVWQAGSDLTGLIHHSDRGSQYVSIAYTNRLAELGIKPSVGSVGDSYDNALAEAVNAAYKTELITPGGPWKTTAEVELATLEWVWWFNNERLHENLSYRTPTEYEASHQPASQPASQPTPALANT